MSDIQRFRNNKKLIEAVSFLKLEFPVKDISTRMGVDKGNLSSFLNNKKSVSKNFLEMFEKEYSTELLGFVYNKEFDQQSIEDSILKEPVEDYGLDYKELYLREKEIVDILKKQIIDLELQLGIKRNAG